MKQADKTPGKTHPNLKTRASLARALVDDIAPGRAVEPAGCARDRRNRLERPAVPPDIAARILEIRTEPAPIMTEAEPLIRQLLDAAAKARLLHSAAGYAAVRGLVAEAARLQSRAADPVTLAPPRPRLPEMTSQEWLAAYGPKRAATR